MSAHRANNTSVECHRQWNPPHERSSAERLGCPLPDRGQCYQYPIMDNSQYINAWVFPVPLPPHVTTEFWQEEGIEWWLSFFLKLLVKHYIREEKEQGLTVKTVCCHIVPTDRGRTSHICGTFGLVFVFPENVFTLWSQRLRSKDEKQSSTHCLYKRPVKHPRAALLYRSLESALSDFFAPLLFSYISICIV